ncbi:MAG: alpha-ketoglutarate-dependent dioxygenase AlkB [bacterium]|nr:alpha-ketoglutarate-dependent dioxygenase AlkB [bacterium]
MDLFSTQTLVKESNNLLPKDGEVIYYANCFNLAQSERLFEALNTQIEWQQDTIKIYGKGHLIPRLNAWYGDAGKTYAYSGLHLEPHSWTAELLEIKASIEALSGASFNSVLLNLYRNGNHSMGWHSDDERELGKNPIIASVNFGATRSFHLRHKQEKSRIKLDLYNGSMLLMKGQTQHHWQHQVPKTKKPLGPRINLTFRTVK